MEISNEDIFEKLTKIHAEVKLTNGRMTKAEGHIKFLFRKLRIIQNDDLTEAGIKKGKRVMRTIIGGIIVTVLTIGISAGGLYFVAKTTIANAKKEQAAQLNEKLDRLVRLITKDVEPVTETDMAERLKSLLQVID